MAGVFRRPWLRVQRPGGRLVPGGANTVIALVGIASTAAVGSPSIGGQIVTTAGDTTGGIGSPLLTASISPTGIASGEALGSPAVTGFVAPNGIASTSAVGVVTLPTLSDIEPVGIASVDAVGVPWVRAIPADAPAAYVPAPPAHPISPTFIAVSSGPITCVSDTVYTLTGNVGIITINQAQRIEIDGAGFSCQEIVIICDFANNLDEDYASDLYIHDLTLTVSGGGNAIDMGIGGRRIWFDNVTTPPTSPTYAVWGSGHQGACDLDDLLFTNSSIESAGTAQSCMRVMSAHRSMTYLCTLGCPQFHSWRVHGIPEADDATNNRYAEYYWLSDTTLRSKVYIGYNGRFPGGASATEGVDNVIIRRTTTTHITDNVNYWIDRADFAATKTLGYASNVTYEDNVYTVNSFTDSGDIALATGNRNSIEAEALTVAGCTATNNLLSTEDSSTITTAGIPSEEALGVPLIVGQVQATGIASTSAVGAPEVLSPAIEPDGIASTSAVGAPVQSGQVRPTGVASASAVGEPLLVAEGIITVVGIPSTCAVGLVALVSTIWDLPVALHTIPGSFGELAQQVLLATTRTASQRILINGQPADTSIDGGSP